MTSVFCVLPLLSELRAKAWCWSLLLGKLVLLSVTKPAPAYGTPAISALEAGAQDQNSPGTSLARGGIGGPATGGPGAGQPWRELSLGNPSQDCLWTSPELGASQNPWPRADHLHTPDALNFPDLPKLCT